MKELYENYLTTSEKNNISIISISEEEREKGMETRFKQIVDENLPNPWKEVGPQIQKENRTLVTSIQRGLLQGTLY